MFFVYVIALFIIVSIRLKQTIQLQVVNGSLVDPHSCGSVLLYALTFKSTGFLFLFLRLIIADSVFLDLALCWL